MLGFALRFASPVSGDVQHYGPSLTLGFAADQYAMGAIGTRPTPRQFGDLITFTRAGGGGLTNSTGQFEWVGTNVPRLTYDPVTLQPLGLLVEEQRTNLLLWSADPANAAWVKTSASIGASTPGPLALGAQKLVEAAGGSVSPSISQFSVVASGASVVGMRFAKAGERSFVRMQTASSGGTAYAASRFNLADGAKVAGDSDVALNGATNVMSGSVNVGDGWWMLWLSCTLPAGVTTASTVTRIVPDAVAFSYTGDGTSGIYIGPAGLEVGSAPSTYIPTTTAQVTRAADVCSVNTLSPWYNPLEGTIVVKFVRRSISPSQTFATLRGAANSTITLESGFGSPGQLRMRVNDAGTQQAIPVGLGSGVVGVPYKMAGAYKADYFAVSVNGQPEVVDTSGTVPAVSRVEIGSLNGVAFANATIASIEYYPRVIDVQQASA